MFFVLAAIDGSGYLKRGTTTLEIVKDLQQAEFYTATTVRRGMLEIHPSLPDYGTWTIQLIDIRLSDALPPMSMQPAVQALPGVIATAIGREALAKVTSVSRSLKEIILHFPDRVMTWRFRDNEWHPVRQRNRGPKVHQPPKPCRFNGHLYYESDDGVQHHLAALSIVAVTQVEAERKAMDEHWDPRLDSSSCTPVFDWAEPLEIEETEEGEQ